MCGRYTLKVDTRQVAARFHLPATNVSAEVEPRYNIAPSQMNPVITANDGNHLELMQWGLVPAWAKEAKSNYSTINARVETLTSSPTYRKPLRRQRCLVPATGFYEWQVVGGKASKAARQPFYFELAEDGSEGQLFAFAGLYDVWHGPDGRELKSYTIITTGGNDLVRPVHERMPVILPREAEQRWLDPELGDPEELIKLLQPYPATLMRGYPVSLAVNRPANDGLECIAPLAG
jgi:putative SOS response-associated peptidase YedK